MYVLIHDFAGHPFQLQLSRALAARGHSVLHVYPSGLQGPKGRVEHQPGDSSRFRVRSLALSRCFRKYSPVRRLVAQRRYALDLMQLITGESPDVILSGNTPIEVQTALLYHCHRRGVGFVHWVQDVYCEALRFLLKRRMGLLSPVAVAPFRFLEGWVSRNSDAVVVISPAFLQVLQRMHVPSSKVTVIENWASLDEICPMDHCNAWRVSQALDERPVFLYSGTLGLKHRPDLLYRLAQSLGPWGQVVVSSEGVGRGYLEQMPALDNLKLVGFQPYSRLSEVLASADVLVATLESDAGVFAVPSKVLTYLCAGRPVLLAAPRSNLVADVVMRSRAGVVVDPEDQQAWMDAALHLAVDHDLRVELGVNARRYAEVSFDIQAIAPAFERVLEGAIRQRRDSRVLVESSPMSSMSQW